MSVKELTTARKAAEKAYREYLQESGQLCLRCWPEGRSPCVECGGDRSIPCRGCWAPRSTLYVEDQHNDIQIESEQYIRGL